VPTVGRPELCAPDEDRPARERGDVRGFHSHEDYDTSDPTQTSPCRHPIWTAGKRAERRRNRTSGARSCGTTLVTSTSFCGHAGSATACVRVVPLGRAMR
jgi:hypothetical protein